ncbi:uncharacterized protein BDR25DRAFT_362975 [Lindgomyces ingoldianus]|uniref:Uncharacterized protein n=1 Tax=Lindgomyces ingoldianus TaxID=673940 RepID=A0ACB6Q8M2_9PLEO|nr:uncharacterized protein BDR25DRAFT_362975 [Lindgomyces ingoldianus]KAF2463246.1 hypothetical protein BDR25DRAFT_362975 [Lindgomyces ingoldianus]
MEAYLTQPKLRSNSSQKPQLEEKKNGGFLVPAWVATVLRKKCIEKRYGFVLEWMKMAEQVCQYRYQKMPAISRQRRLDEIEVGENIKAIYDETYIKPEGKYRYRFLELVNEEIAVAYDRTIESQLALPHPQHFLRVDIGIYIVMESSYSLHGMLASIRARGWNWLYVRSCIGYFFAHSEPSKRLLAV